MISVIFPLGPWEASSTVELNFSFFLAALFLFPFLSRFFGLTPTVYSQLPHPSLSKQKQRAGNVLFLDRGHTINVEYSVFCRTEQQRLTTVQTQCLAQINAHSLETTTVLSNHMAYSLMQNYLGSCWRANELNFNTFESEVNALFSNTLSTQAT